MAKQEAVDKPTAPSGPSNRVQPGLHEPSPFDVSRELARHADKGGSVHADVIKRLIDENAWCGRFVEVLRLFATDEQRMAYLAGGRRAEEIVRWISPWVESALSIDEIDHVLRAGGWDPDPFVVLSSNGLLDAFLSLPDGSTRMVSGELAGRWLSDEFALADDRAILIVARSVIENGVLTLEDAWR